METTLPQQNPSFVRRTFAAIAARYDLANHLLSGGFDFLWRARAARIIASGKPGRILDLATGSGDLALALQKASPHSLVVAADFCLPMLEMARRKRVPALVQADGLQLPFQDKKFDALTVAFGLRNMAAWDAALQEMARVLRPGGVLLVMDFSLPEFALLRSIYRVYLHRVLPRFAAVITGNREAYEYLGSSIEAFPRGRKMQELMHASGLTEFRAKSLCFGVASIYTARKAYK
jgi:demethylmenaquinone methyltransferase / 2-methoxy-6-polyprenyl-1,4-benzoquinol methylase